jgi:hypothetical protein
VGGAGDPTSTTTPGDTTTTTVGSGIGNGDNGGVGTEDGMAETGGESMLAVGLGLAAAAIVARRVRGV